MFEGFFKPKLTAEQQSAKQAFDEADPTTYSALPPEGKLRSEWKLNFKQNKIVSDRDSRYFEVVKSPGQQQALARMVKGIINVSDIVSVEDKNPNKNKHYYSREMPLERIEKETPQAEILADMFILHAIFSNADRSHSENVAHNVNVGHGRAAHFDFEGGSITKNQFTDTREKLHALDPNGMRIAREKLLALRERFKGEGGLNFLTAVVEASGRTAWNLFAHITRKYTVADLQKNLLFRIDKSRADIDSLSEVLSTVDLPR